MFASLYVGAPQSVLQEMYENGYSFEEAMDDYSSGYLGTDAYESVLGMSAESLLDTDTDAIEKAVYQLSVGTVSPGGMTPYGPALTPEELSIIEEEYPGVSAGGDSSWSDDEWGQWFDDAGTLYQSEELDELETSIYEKASSEGHLDRLADYYNGVADQIDEAYRTGAASSYYNEISGNVYEGLGIEPGSLPEGMLTPGVGPARVGGDIDPSTPGNQLYWDDDGTSPDEEVSDGRSTLDDIKSFMGDVADVLTNVAGPAINELSNYLSMTSDTSGGNLDRLPAYLSETENIGEFGLEQNLLEGTQQSLSSPWDAFGAKDEAANAARIAAGIPSTEERVEALISGANLSPEEEKAARDYVGGFGIGTSPGEVITKEISQNPDWDGTIEEFLQMAQVIIDDDDSGYSDLTLATVLNSPQFYDLADEFDPEGTWDDYIEEYIQEQPGYSVPDFPGGGMAGLEKLLNQAGTDGPVGADGPDGGTEWFGPDGKALGYKPIVGTTQFWNETTFRWDGTEWADMALMGGDGGGNGGGGGEVKKEFHFWLNGTWTTMNVTQTAMNRIYEANKSKGMSFNDSDGKPWEESLLTGGSLWKDASGGGGNGGGTDHWLWDSSGKAWVKFNDKAMSLGDMLKNTQYSLTDPEGKSYSTTIDVKQALKDASDPTSSKAQNTEDLRKVFYKKMYALPNGTDRNRTYQYAGLLADTKSLFLLYTPSLAGLYNKVADDSATPEDLSLIERSYDSFLNGYLENPEAYRTGAKLDTKVAELNKYFSLSRAEQVKDPNTLMFDSFYGDDEQGLQNRNRLWSMSVTKGQRGYYSNAILNSVNKLAQYYRNTGMTENDVFRTLTNIGKPSTAAVQTEEPLGPENVGEFALQQNLQGGADTGIQDFMGYND